jgi:amidase
MPIATEVAYLDAIDQAALVRTGAIRARELVEAAIERIETYNPVLNAVITPTFDRARATADAEPTGPFAGVPMLLKDLAIETPGVAFSEGSKFLDGYVSSFESELAARFRRAGLISLGKTNTPEFGMAPACEPVRFGPTRNPWNLDRSTSGSSGGSAAAVAAGLVPIAHANDLGGSIRYPASACGVFGLKPTRARNPLGPRYGDVLSGAACEHVLTRSVRDSAAVLDATAGPLAGDPYHAPTQLRPYADEVGRDPGRLRIAFSPMTPDGTPGHPDCVSALERTALLLEGLGHEVSEVAFVGLSPMVRAAIDTMIISAASWIVAYWVREIGRHPEEDELEPSTRQLCDAGSRVSAADYLLAIEDLQQFSRGVASFMSDIDVWLTPTLSSPPQRIGDIARAGDTVRYAGVIANVSGNPAMSVPLESNAEGMPIGMHFLGRFGDEATLFRLAAQLEVAQPWAHRWPPISAIRDRSRVRCSTGAL